MKLSCSEFAQLYCMNSSSNKILLDVRREDEVKAGILAGAKHIPIQELDKRYNELNKDADIFVYCAMGGRAEKAQMLLQHYGFKSVCFAGDGGYADLKSLL